MQVEEDHPDYHLLYPPGEPRRLPETPLEYHMGSWAERTTMEQLEVLNETGNITGKWEVTPPNYRDPIEFITRIQKKISNNLPLNPTMYRQRLQPLVSSNRI